MRIYDLDADSKVNNIIIYLTPDEAKEMRSSLELIMNNKKHHHEHISDADFKREITVCIYREDDLLSFDERSKKLILDDE